MGFFFFVAGYYNGCGGGARDECRIGVMRFQITFCHLFVAGVSFIGSVLGCRNLSTQRNLSTLSGALSTWEAVNEAGGNINHLMCVAYMIEFNLQRALPDVAVFKE